MTEIRKRISKNMPLSALSGFSFIPERRDHNELTYFGNQKKEVSVLLYDQVFKVQEGYNNKTHRDDREHSHHQGLNINDEERARTVPVLASSFYDVFAKDLSASLGRSRGHLRCYEEM
ncbi:cilia- and flagella-associated protein 90 isoform X3 [Hemiscyllium ocellatum]|uniref:cilia- and flagella-associated protein 90 isoform X3 n=1 Tax=Hemiscyllium ocellatum TaxID=170820 RepID=UPI00296643EB|nr:cilia- and flagella-associated protein 90 isoform X3 [Hemiscyllium ocellatum]